MINDLKDLRALFKLCRAQGITDFKMGEIEITLGSLPEKSSSLQGEDDAESTMPSDDDLLYYSTPQGQAELDRKVGMR